MLHLVQGWRLALKRCSAWPIYTNAGEEGRERWTLEPGRNPSRAVLCAPLSVRWLMKWTQGLGNWFWLRLISLSAHPLCCMHALFVALISLSTPSFLLTSWFLSLAFLVTDTERVNQKYGKKTLVYFDHLSTSVVSWLRWSSYITTFFVLFLFTCWPVRLLSLGTTETCCFNFSWMHLLICGWSFLSKFLWDYLCTFYFISYGFMLWIPMCLLRIFLDCRVNQMFSETFFFYSVQF